MSDITRNMKVIHFCWECNKEHDLGQRSPNEHGIKCECGGYVVTPSGKILQIALKPIVPVFKVDDGETHRFAAADENELRAYYKELYGEELEPDATIEKVEDPEELNRRFIHMDDGRQAPLSLNQIINETDHFPALLCSSVW